MLRVTVWWSRVWWSEISITANVNSEILNTMVEKLARLQPALVDCSSPLTCTTPSNLILHTNIHQHTLHVRRSGLKALHYMTSHQTLYIQTSDCSRI